MQITEHRTHARGLADLLLYHALVDDGILLQQDGSLLAAWSYRGPDTMSASDAEMAALSARLNSVLRLGSGWMVQCDAIRSQAPGYPAAGAFPDTVTRVIDDERRQQFTAEGAHYESEYFLTLTYLPPVEAEEKVKGWMFEGHAHRSEPAQLILDRFKSRLEAFENVFGQLFKIERLRLTTEEDGVSTRTQDRLLRYERAQVFAFDKGYSLYVLNRASGGEFYDLAGPKTRLAFCPLRELDTDADVTWAVGWLEALCVLNNLKVTPKHRNALTEAVQHLRLSPSRTLTELSANVQDMDVRDALQHFTLAGPLGSLLDADEDVLGSGRFLTFETENLLQLDDKSVLPVLLYLFRRIEKRLDGSPTLVLLDEAWVYLRHGLFRERMRDWLKTLRRMNGVVVMATQQLSDICNSEIADVVIENCPTKILLPNAESRSPGSREFYQRVGLNERELEILQVSVPKQHYYVVSSLGRRLVDLGIGRVALSWVGVNGREERQLVESVIEEFPSEWRSEWLRLRGLPKWADYLDRMEKSLEQPKEE
jgi:type IV secretory pathway VirB4 component